MPLIFPMKETMCPCIYRATLIFICIGLSAVHLHTVCCLKSRDLALRHSLHYQASEQKNHRILETDVAKKILNTDKKPASEKKKFHPNKSYKLKVPRGSDPIHNRTWSKDGNLRNITKVAHIIGHFKQLKPYIFYSKYEVYNITRETQITVGRLLHHL